ncbi:proteasome subunit alpha [Dactylosporangium matsuzakiense]|uniref:Proteasome subunit alpha n=1 Tax=Dactylosporangium matsuzakiense TaxID=53360 RepID=A0A9W6KGD6_9ACTN|nr:proteasome subunit alpha [Dactylosporangium matsuzakiense]UWZ42135.1 proteasome subunit alpha [Dactylosporangium matsuzakiense]GLK99765.1 proteasome subunit alpha [Dactylosporangium matsuzakiense]
MAMQFYASPEQIMRDRSEYARKGIARGRSVMVLSYEGGVLFVAENLSTALHKVSEIYDRIGFAAVGRYPEFEALRSAGVRLADLHGYSYARGDVTGRQIANFYARNLGAIFTQEQKPYEVEICVAEAGLTAEDDELYRITYDGSVQDEQGMVTMGGQSDAVATAVKSRLRPDQTLAEALKLAVEGLASVGGENGQPRTLAAHQLEVAVLDRNRPGRTFRRLTGLALTAILDDTSGTTKDADIEEGLEDKPQPPASPSTPADNASGGPTPAPAEPGDPKPSSDAADKGDAE